MSEVKPQESKPNGGRGKRRLTTKAGKKHWKKLFLASLKRIPNVRLACDTARISQQTAFNNRKRNAKFAEQWEEALSQGIQMLEGKMWERAAYGTPRPIWMKDQDGKPTKVDEVREFDTTAGIFMLKAHAPAKYRETTRHELTGSDGGPVSIALDPVVSSALEKAYGVQSPATPKPEGTKP